MKKTIQTLIEELNSANRKINKITTRIDELSHRSDVGEYIKLTEEKEKLEKLLSQVTSEIAENTMWNCHHLFIITSRSSKSSGKEPIFHCLRCGLTNYYFEEEVPLEHLTKLEVEMEAIFDETRTNGLLVSNEVIPDINAAKRALDTLTKSLPGVTDEILTRKLEKSLCSKVKTKTR